MSRKTEPTYKTEQGIFPTRLRELMQQRGTKQKELADAIDMRPQTVSLYTTGQSAPDVNTLKKICEFFNVNADYLLGRTNVSTTDIDIQMIANYTGLSRNAIFWLHEMSKDETEIFNLLLDHAFFPLTLKNLVELKQVISDEN